MLHRAYFQLYVHHHGAMTKLNIMRSSGNTPNINIKRGPQGVTLPNQGVVVAVTNGPGLGIFYSDGTGQKFAHTYLHSP